MSQSTLEISATIFWITTAAGGRQTPVASGYRPSFLFYGEDEKYLDGNLFFELGLIGQPGEETQVKLYPLCRELWDFAKIADQFAVMEGKRIVGVGVIQSRGLGLPRQAT